MDWLAFLQTDDNFRLMSGTVGSENFPIIERIIFNIDKLGSPDVMAQ